MFGAGPSWNRLFSWLRGSDSELLCFSSFCSDLFLLVAFLLTGLFVLCFCVCGLSAFLWPVSVDQESGMYDSCCFLSWIFVALYTGGNTFRVSHI